MSELRDELERAFDSHAEPDDKGLGAGETVNEEVVEQPAASKTADARARDEAGRFAPAKAEDKVPPDPQQKPEEVVQEAQKPAAPAPAQQQATQQVRAPVSWRPEVRGKFGSLPPDVQEEVTRRERDHEAVLRESAQSRRFVNDFLQVITPYEAIIRAENSTPLQAVQNLMNTAYQLRAAAPQQKAQLVAGIIQTYGIDIGLLDEILSSAVQGQPRREDPTLSYVQQELAPVRQFMETISAQMQQGQQRMQQTVAEEIQQFASDNSEFFDIVREDVADLLEMAARRGQKLSLQDAFKRATMAHPTISKLIADRTVQQTAQQRSSAAQRSRAASASLPSGGAPEQSGAATTNPGNLRSAINAAWEAAEAKSRE